MIKTTLGHLLNAVGYFPAPQTMPPQAPPFARLAALTLPAGQKFKIARIGTEIDKHVSTFREIHQALETEEIPVDDPQYNPAIEGEQKRLTEDSLAQLNDLLAQPVTLQAEPLRVEQFAQVPLEDTFIYSLTFLFVGFEYQPETPAEKAKGVPNPKPKNKHKLAAVPANA